MTHHGNYYKCDTPNHGNILLIQQIMSNNHFVLTQCDIVSSRPFCGFCLCNKMVFNYKMHLFLKMSDYIIMQTIDMTLHGNIYEYETPNYGHIVFIWQKMPTNHFVLIQCDIVSLQCDIVSLQFSIGAPVALPWHAEMETRSSGCAGKYCVRHAATCACSCYMHQ